MFRVYHEVLELIRVLRAFIEEIERRDPDLGRQMRRALPSVALNMAEASGSRGRNRGARFSNALGSMRETRACLEVAEALGYIGLQAEIVMRIDRICAALYSLAR